MAADETLKRARKFASGLRFSGDNLPPGITPDDSSLGAVTGFYAQQGLKISKEVTPALQASLSIVCRRLFVPEEAVTGFVFPSAEIQATCFSDHPERCVLQFTSSLIDLLDEGELRFVIGHELGHFLLGHSISTIGAEESIELYLQQRAQEISSDRIGHVACESRDLAIRAMMKLASGLSDQHLRFDVTKFIQQIEHITPQSLSRNQDLTHPSLLVRSRALMWFEMEGATANRSSGHRSRDLSKIDARIEDDLSRYVDGPAREKIADARETLAMWVFMTEVVQTGSSFNKDQQARFGLRFGDDLLKKMLDFLTGQNKHQVTEAVNERLNTATTTLQKFIPMSFNNELHEIQEQTRSLVRTEQ